MSSIKCLFIFLDLIQIHVHTGIHNDEQERKKTTATTITPITAVSTPEC